MRRREVGLKLSPVAFIHIVRGLIDLVRGVGGPDRVEAGRVEVGQDRLEADPDRLELNLTNTIHITHPRAPKVKYSYIFIEQLYPEFVRLLLIGDFNPSSDDNCGFRALSHYIMGDDSHYLLMRVELI
ncbi:unnamed protein product [Linum tenue]|uniref:Uncharacterized protein n=1 Tax=Linum tenue TaxID=586396 RepID=A0AAV0NM61_9ROSI|nr:unnamed protein product [Linum tenue]